MRIHFIDLLLIGAPENIITLFIILFVFHKEKLEMPIKKVFCKFLLSIFLILTGVFLSKNYFGTLAPPSFIATLMYITALKSIWKVKSSQSFLLGFASMTFLMATDIIGSCPFASKIIEPKFFQENRFLATLPTRIIQIVILFIIIKFRVSMTNRILEKVENSFFYNKMTANFLLALFITCVISMAVYANKFFNSSLSFGLFIAVIFFTLSTIILLIRTRNYENYKKIFKNDVTIIKSLTDRYKNDLSKLEEYKIIIENQIKETKKTQDL